ncbi:MULTISPECIES: YciI family protein [Burkholderia cepacia complex]|uniref:YciI family protein n=1 Tax=Burkholderia cepacia complex TaxID=87882 RepID=UPI00158C6BC7|nr:YciI family protein [Burkholderia anthina]
MLFAIKLNYIRPTEEVHAHLESHKAWLVKHVKAGSILFAGPLLGEAAGLLLAYADHRGDVENMIAEDPFDILGLATFDIQCCDPALRASAFPAQWAGGARPV